MTKIWAKADIKRSFFARSAKKGLGLGRSSPQELEEGPRSGLHILVNSYIDSDSDNRDSDRGIDIHCHPVASS